MKVCDGLRVLQVDFREQDRNEQEKTQREIAQMYGISRSYVSRIEKKALEKLRRCYEAKYV